jgi:hypothetical protein
MTVFTTASTLKDLDFKKRINWDLSFDQDFRTSDSYKDGTTCLEKIQVNTNILVRDVYIKCYSDQLTRLKIDFQEQYSSEMLLNKGYEICSNKVRSKYKAEASKYLDDDTVTCVMNNVSNKMLAIIERDVTTALQSTPTPSDYFLEETKIPNMIPDQTLIQSTDTELADRKRKAADLDRLNAATKESKARKYASSEPSFNQTSSRNDTSDYVRHESRHYREVERYEDTRERYDDTRDRNRATHRLPAPWATNQQRSNMPTVHNREKEYGRDTRTKK